MCVSQTIDSDHPIFFSRLNGVLCRLVYRPVNAFALHTPESGIESFMHSLGTRNLEYRTSSLYHSIVELVLCFSNKMWFERYFLFAFKVALVVSLLKRGKDLSYASSYRPIDFTTFLFNALERIITRKILHYCAKITSLNRCQCGFRTPRVIVYNLVRLETAVRETFVNRQQFFSLCVFNPTNVIEFGIRVCLLGFIQSYLECWSLCAKLGNIFL